MEERYCSQCGRNYTEIAWPLTCHHCGSIRFRNPTPVSVVLVPVAGSVLVIERGGGPGAGKLALPGGFVEVGESWQEAGVRELEEETGLSLPPESIREWLVRSTPHRENLIVFGIAPELEEQELPHWSPNPEAAGRYLIDGPIQLAFSTHTEAVQVYFETRSREHSRNLNRTAEIRRVS